MTSILETAGPMDPVACAVFLLAAFVMAGGAQTVWFKSRRSRRFAWPLDAGLTIRGRRLFGDNKTVRGLVVMIPASAAAFALLGSVGEPEARGLWPLPASGYAALGAWAALGFMAGELPNSFIKRQLAVAPGARASSSAAWVCQFIADRIDSGVGMLLALSVAVPTPWLTWLYVLLAGPLLHWGFSILMFHLGIKSRPA
jgi:CDP-2,3-bis-(O-geranylgeranyl)-sn-glycerol synthase